MTESKYLAAWRVVEEAFPRDGTHEEQLRFLTAYAILAPSIHNVQPWKFRVHGRVLDLYVDRRRALPIEDPRDRTLIISCGAALFNLRTAMYYFGCAATAEPFPEPQRPDLVARVHIVGPTVQTRDWGPLFHAIARRVTNRSQFDARPVPPAVIDELCDVAHIEGAWLMPFRTPYARKQIESMIAEGSRIQFGNPRFRRELANWLRPAGDKEGVPRYAMGVADELPDYAASVIAYMIRTFDVGPRVAARNVKLAESAPLLACLGTARDDALGWLNAGQALQRVLLTATVHGLQASFLNQPIEVARLRPRLDALIEHRGQPQLLLRIGRGRMRTPTPRRMLEEVLLGEADQETSYPARTNVPGASLTAA